MPRPVGRSMTARRGLFSLSRLVARLSSELAAPFEPLPLRLPLLKFGAHTLGDWQLHSDEPFGGYSESSLTPIEGATDCALWSGRTSLEANPLAQQQYQRSDQKAVASKVGFVAMMRTVQEEHGWELHNFHGLCLTCRPRDARTARVGRGDSRGQ